MYTHRFVLPASVAVCVRARLIYRVLYARTAMAVFKAPRVVDALDTPKIIHRLDRQTTGVLLVRACRLWMAVHRQPYTGYATCCRTCGTNQRSRTLLCVVFGSLLARNSPTAMSRRCLPSGKSAKRTWVCASENRVPIRGSL